MSNLTRAFAAVLAALTLSSCAAAEAAEPVSTTPTVTLPTGTSAPADKSDPYEAADEPETSSAAEDKSAEKHGDKTPTVVFPEYFSGDTAPLIYNSEPIVRAYKTGDRTGLNELQNDILDKATAILYDIISDDMSDYEKELAVHDYLVINCTYDEGARAVIPKPAENSDNPYGALVNGTAVCTGYTTAFRMLMDMLDIPCETVYYQDKDTDHAWNIVTIGGAKYYVDVTWDDPVPDKTRRLTYHSYFNVSREDLERDHTLPENTPDTPVFADTFASHKLAPEPGTKDELQALLKTAVDEDRNTLYFIPSEGSLWSTGFAPSRDGTLTMTDNTLKQALNSVFGREGCTFRKAMYVDTDKGKALCLIFSKVFPENG